MRILCCGDRNWNRPNDIKIALVLAIADNIFDEVTIIHGNANGADRLSGMVALSLDMMVESYPANWSEYGRAAGPIRNQQMLDEGKPNLVIAFHSNLENSKGTADMVRRARKANIPIRVVE